ncbi:MAG: beta-galactosidase [Clostridiales bacterium]|nr:beta-galactosidase [Clostridiales bacterium]
MIYRQEHPKPQFQRANWQNLNGSWQFRRDDGDSGREQGFFEPDAVFDQMIEVPFCPQSKLSGIAYKDFMQAVWYRRSFTLTDEQRNGRVVLHFGAVDYEAIVYVNARECGRHKGGYVSFSFDITEFVAEGENTVVVCARDNERDPMIPRGKQCERFASSGCSYTRTTGIWQTVWLEFTPKQYIKKVRLHPSAETTSVQIEAEMVGCADFMAEASFAGVPMGQTVISSASGSVCFTLPLQEKHLWELGQGGLYDLTFTFGEDRVESYFGLRSIEYRDYKFFLNGRSVFQRLILDQGFYPDGVYTAPDDQELAADIDRSMAMGFNGARLHEKIFEERFLYHCDKKGYLVWGEYPNWGIDVSDPKVIYSVLPEWLEAVERDRNHPSIVGWCPFNETFDYQGRQQFNDLIALVYHATKAADPTRPCIDTSGNFHVITDIYDVHSYEQSPEAFYESYKDLANGQVKEVWSGRQRYDGKKPFFVSEYGGIRWSDDQNGWGYGNGPATPEEFLARLKGLTDVLLDNERMFGLCYTQLTDVEQEQNGLYTYDRKPKFPPEQIAAIFARKAAIEK